MCTLHFKSAAWSISDMAIWDIHAIIKPCHWLTYWFLIFQAIMTNSRYVWSYFFPCYLIFAQFHLLINARVCMNCNPLVYATLVVLKSFSVFQEQIANLIRTSKHGTQQSKCTVLLSCWNLSTISCLNFFLTINWERHVNTGSSGARGRCGASVQRVVTLSAGDLSSWQLRLNGWQRRRTVAVIRATHASVHSVSWYSYIMTSVHLVHMWTCFTLAHNNRPSCPPQWKNDVSCKIPRWQDYNIIYYHV